MLTQPERDFLDAICAGERANDYAKRINYSIPWAKWMSGKVRKKLGVPTLKEAVKVSEFADLERKLTGQIEALANAVREAVTPKEKADAGANLDHELKLLGLTRKDLEAAATAKQEALIDSRVDAALTAREEAAKAKAEEEAAAAEVDSVDGESTVMDKVRDGLGGVRNIGR